MHSQRGFTLLETIIAIGIIAVGISSILSLMNNATNLAREATDRITAANLAQEGLELVKNLREVAYNENADTGSTDWDDYIKSENCEDTTDFCRIDYDNNLLTADNELGARLYIVDNRYKNNPSGVGDATKFSRLVTIEDSYGGSACDFASIAVDDCVLTRSYVWWARSAPIDENDCSSKCVVVENALFNWNKSS